MALDGSKRLPLWSYWPELFLADDLTRREVLWRWNSSFPLSKPQQLHHGKACDRHYIGKFGRPPHAWQVWKDSNFLGPGHCTYHRNPCWRYTDHQRTWTNSVKTSLDLRVVISFFFCYFLFHFLFVLLFLISLSYNQVSLRHRWPRAFTQCSLDQINRTH